MQVFLEGAGFDGNEVDKRSLVSQSKCCESGIRDQRARAAARRSPRRCSLQSASDGGGRLGQSEGVGCRYRRVSRLAVTAARQMEMAGGLARHRDTKHPPKGLGLGRLHARSLRSSTSALCGSPSAFPVSILFHPLIIISQASLHIPLLSS